MSGEFDQIGPVSATRLADGDFIQASDGNFWGDFFAQPGLVFSSTVSGSILENLPLSPGVNGSQPFGLLQAADGKLYGMSFENGAPTNGQPSNGAFWVIDAGLPVPAPTIINFRPASGKPGSTFLLQGGHFVGATSVTIDSHSANFSVLTANYIRITVPAGASTGKVSVTNAGGTSATTKVFTVQ